jgi:hypothetical protein
VYLLFYQLVSVKNLKDKFKNSVVTIQEQKKINYEYYEIKYVKTRFTTFTNSTWKVINPNHTEFGRIITTVNDDGEILSTKENHTYRLNSNCSSHYLKAITIMQGKAVEVLKLGFSSKTLKENYLQGINLNNKRHLQLHTIWKWFLFIW